MSDITESLKKEFEFEAGKLEEIPEKSPEKTPKEKNEEKNKKSFLSRLAESMLYHPWGFPY